MADPRGVLVVDDHRSFADALGLAIDLEADLECVGRAARLDEALELVEKHRPDVVLMDVELPDGDGIEGTRLITQRYPDVRVIILTGRTSSEVLARAAAAGAAGFLRKEEEFPQILRAIRSASDGEMVVEHSTLAAVLHKLHETAPQSGRQHASDLTAREHEVLTLLGQGLDVASIATALTVSTHTARWHVKSILSKLGARSQLEAVVRGIRHGLIPPPSPEA